MVHKGAVEAFNRMLQDLQHNNDVMGGATVLLCGDFRKTLPVVPRGTRADEVNDCLKSSSLWLKIKILHLKTNMRVNLNRDAKAKEFADLLIQIGDRKLKEKENYITIPKELCKLAGDLEALTEHISPDLVNLRKKPISWLKERGILSPKNDRTKEINQVLLQKFHADEMTYSSIDSVVEKEETVNYPVEFLNTLKPSGIPFHKLTLKIGAPIMLLRNLYP
ncbi:uncharacterized protein [Centruroides vittatus]|uniref:uncharacterized protein n=1 Tax=Centruroides vittatus TaxID=120091 RepID=UPI0035103C25